jgi:hypothetical protein
MPSFSNIPKSVKLSMEIALVEMGYDNEIAVYALKSVGYTSSEDAIRFIIDKNPSTDKYLHEFIKLGGTKICMLCYSEKSDHTKELPII